MSKNKEFSDKFQLVRRGSFADIDAAISASDCELRNRDGQNLLQEAVLAKKPDIVEKMIALGSDVDHADDMSKTALHYAVQLGEQGIVSILLESGATVSAADSFGTQPLWTAVFGARGNYRVVEALLERGADPLHRNQSGRSPLDFATQIKDEELEKILRRRV